MIPPRYLFVIPFLFDCSITGAALVVNLHAQDLGASSFQLGLLGTTWGIAYCVATLSSGAVLDHLSRRALGMIGLSLFTGYIFVSSLAKTPQTLTHLCLIAGLGAGVFWPTFETLLHSRDDNRLTSRNMGFFNVGWTLGIATGVGSGGYLKVWGAVPGLHLLTVLNLLTIALLRTQQGEVFRVPNTPEACRSLTVGKPMSRLFARRHSFRSRGSAIS